jgi:hypothetical protein
MPAEKARTLRRAAAHPTSLKGGSLKGGLPDLRAEQITNLTSTLNERNAYRFPGQEAIYQPLPPLAFHSEGWGSRRLDSFRERTLKVSALPNIPFRVPDVP